MYACWEFLYYDSLILVALGLISSPSAARRKGFLGSHKKILKIREH